ncbi:hypothetical protein [Streptomyces sp. GS7]|uniref:hypothetical protein n=1 Tax=Streptomyces sp. GS7 TaxID=2692234 RepID=UPI0013191D0E|nr:hypothetical protein [Streptomyces sp. GS7]QHC23242.1 hypothetical protein GR130_19360 [Streptomyces sp. GS7]
MTPSEVELCHQLTVCGACRGKVLILIRQLQGYTRADGPHPYGDILRIPAPFDIDLDTSTL